MRYLRRADPSAGRPARTWIGWGMNALPQGRRPFYTAGAAGPGGGGAHPGQDGVKTRPLPRAPAMPVRGLPVPAHPDCTHHRHGKNSVRRPFAHRTVTAPPPK
ncbi:hypothetical protein GCM10025734_77350 [Kitasatospora paranensis]